MVKKKTQKIKTPFVCHDTYIDYCHKIADKSISCYGCVSKASDKENELNAYQNLNSINEPKNICLLTEDSIDNDDLVRAHKTILDGRFFSEHTAAKVATRSLTSSNSK